MKVVNRRFLLKKQKLRCYAYLVIVALLTVGTFFKLHPGNEVQADFKGFRSRRLFQFNPVNDTQKLTSSDSATTAPTTSYSEGTTQGEKEQAKDIPTTIATTTQGNSSNETCEPPSVTEFPPDLFNEYQRKHGAILVHLVIALYMFLGLALICDYYFVASLQVICYKLKLQADVAGASFMAIGSSAPELFASLIGVFITKGDIGIGTILGSAVFNVLFVLGISAIIATQELNLSWWPVTRDTLCYAITLICLAMVIIDGFVTWIESAVMLVLYSAYLTLMWQNERLEKWFYLYIGDHKTYSERFERLSKEEEEHNEELAARHKEEKLQWSDDEESDSEEEAFPDEPPKKVLELPDGCFHKLQWFISFPINIVFFLTIPDIRRPSLRSYYVLTFVISISWIGFLTYVLVWMVTIIGFTINIPDTVMGLTFIAFGSSVPDALASMCVAKQGKGDMAVSQALGSNVFDILFGLGLPWLIKTLIFDTDSTIEVQSVGMLISCFTIFVLILLNLAALYYENFVLSRKVGYGLLIAYALFLGISVLMEIYIWSSYHLPTCTS